MADLTSTAANQNLTVDRRTHHLAVVLDRSGSMTGSRWENAKTAGRLLAHLFVAFRSTAAPTPDRMTEVVFEDAACNWHAGMSPLIVPVLPLSTAAAADAAICSTTFGPAGSCTPIGDGLIKAMDDLGGLGVLDDPQFTVVLLTDGFENSGSVKVNPSTPTPAGIVTFESARTATISRQAVSARMRLFAVGLGSSIDEQALNALPLPSGTGATGIYRKIQNVGELEEALAYMVAFSAGAEQVPPTAFDPTVNSRILPTEAQISRLAIGVLWDTSNPATPNHELTLERRDQVPSSTWTPIDVATKKCPTHGFLSVDVASLFGGAANVPASEWRVTHLAGTTTPPTGQLSIPDGDLLAFVDLFVRAELTFDREQYRSGDPMILTVRIRAGDQPVTGARVTAELARPGESLGTFLAKHGADYKPGTPSGPDPLAPKAAMLAQLLQQEGMEELPVLAPQGFFVDGTDELFDDGVHDDGGKDDGNYANTFDKTDAEGTYTWRFAVHGRLSDGSAFSRLITVSKWVGVHIDPGSSPITNRLLSSGDGLTSTLISVRPASSTGLFLGPFMAADVVIDADACQFESREVGPVGDGIVYRAANGGTITSHYDGSYSRVLVCKDGERATVTVIAGGEKLRPVEIGGSGAPTSWWDWLVQLIIRFVKWVRKLLGI